MLLNKKTVKMPGADPAFSQSSPYIISGTFLFELWRLLQSGMDRQKEAMETRPFHKKTAWRMESIRQAVSSVLFEFIDDFIEP